MLGSLTGTITDRLGDRCLINVDGVGYWVHTGGWQPHGAVHCYLYHQVREDISELYGFESLPSLALFEKLLTVSGIGPKAALALLSVGPAAALKAAITGQDTAYLSSAPGVGTKAAQKIVLELSGKLGEITFPDEREGVAADAELRLALESLGYRPADISAVLGRLPSEYTILEEQIRWALQQLTRS